MRVTLSRHLYLGRAPATLRFHRYGAIVRPDADKECKGGGRDGASLDMIRDLFSAFNIGTSRARGLRGIWVSGGETEGLHFVGVLSFGDEFREDGAFWGIQEKFGEALGLRGGDDELGGRDTGANGSQPSAERAPDEPGMGNGEVLKQSLADDAGLDEDVVKA